MVRALEPFFFRCRNAFGGGNGAEIRWNCHGCNSVKVPTRWTLAMSFQRVEFYRKGEMVEFDGDIQSVVTWVKGGGPCFPWHENTTPKVRREMPLHLSGSLINLYVTRKKLTFRFSTVLPNATCHPDDGWKERKTPNNPISRWSNIGKKRCSFTSFLGKFMHFNLMGRHSMNKTTHQAHLKQI